MQRFWLTIIIALFSLNSAEAAYNPFAKLYSNKLCKQEGFICEKLVVNSSWEELWPNAKERLIVQKLNRLNRAKLPAGITLAVPKNLSGKTLMDFSPFKKTVKELKDLLSVAVFEKGEDQSDPLPFSEIDKIPTNEKFVIFDPALLAFGAYDKEGNLVRWGPALGGQDYCADIKRACRTPVGTNFRVTFKGGKNSRSPAYPIGCKGNTCAPMPYVMYFLKLYYGIHGSNMIVGYNASHGCVRTFTDDAKWLSKNFVEVGTRVIVRPYPYPLPTSKKKK